MATASPATLGGLVHLYGDASPCWRGSPADADACALACANAAAKTRYCQNPDPTGDPFVCGEVVAQPDPSLRLALSLGYRDRAGQVPTGVSPLLCAVTDPRCNAPISTLEDKPAGTVLADVGLGFDGYFAVSAPGFVPTYRLTAHPLKRTTRFEQPMWRSGELATWVDRILGATSAYDGVDAGVVFLEARDCNQKLLAGVRFSTSATGERMRFVYLTASGEASGGALTGATGIAALVNVAPGLHTFEAEIAAPKRRLGSARVLVRAGAVTAFTLLPSP